MQPKKCQERDTRNCVFLFSLRVASGDFFMKSVFCQYLARKITLNAIFALCFLPDFWLHIDLVQVGILFSGPDCRNSQQTLPYNVDLHVHVHVVQSLDLYRYRGNFTSLKVYSTGRSFSQSSQWSSQTMCRSVGPEQIQRSRSGLYMYMYKKINLSSVSGRTTTYHRYRYKHHTFFPPLSQKKTLYYQIAGIFTQPWP